MTHARPVCVALFLMLALSGCTRWQVTNAPLPTVTKAEGANRVRLTKSDGTQVEVRHPYISGDSLAAAVAGWSDNTAVTVNLAEFRLVEVGRFDGKRTALVIGAFLTGVAVAAFVFATSAHRSYIC